MSLQDQVSSNVKLLAMSRGTTPTAIARSLGHPPAWIQSKIAGRNRWHVDDLEVVAGELHVDVTTLVSGAWIPDELRPRQDSNLQPTDLRSRYGLAA
jgi:hypothetical protein